MFEQILLLITGLLLTFLGFVIIGQSKPNETQKRLFFFAFGLLGCALIYVAGGK